MINFKNMMKYAMCALICLLSFSCEEEITDIYTVSIGEEVQISKNTVRNGDYVYLSIGKLAFDKNDDVIKNNLIDDNEKGIPMIHYLIDGVEVMKSNKKSEQYAVEYKVSNLSVGKHVLSVSAMPQEDFVQYISIYRPCEFYVVESE